MVITEPDKTNPRLWLKSAPMPIPKVGMMLLTKPNATLFVGFICLEYFSKADWFFRQVSKLDFSFLYRLSFWEMILSLVKTFFCSKDMFWLHKLSFFLIWALSLSALSFMLSVNSPAVSFALNAAFSESNCFVLFCPA